MTPTKEDTPIPADIDRIATDIVRADYSKSGDDPDWLLYVAIAKAILFEREACARRAEAKDRAGREWVSDSLWANVRREIAADIRRGFNRSYPFNEQNPVPAKSRQEARTPLGGTEAETASGASEVIGAGSAITFIDDVGSI